MFYQNMLTISRFFEDFALPALDEREDRVSPDFSAKGQRVLEGMRRGPCTLMAKLLLPALGNAARKPAWTQTCVVATCVACALDRYRLRSEGSVVAREDVARFSPLEHRLHLLRPVFRFAR